MAVSVRKNTRYEILTPDGFKDFDGVRRSDSSDLRVVVFDDQTRLTCTPGHLIQLDTLEFKPAASLVVGDRATGKNGVRLVVSVESAPSEPVYDALEVRDGHAYYTNGVVSHNCSFLGSSGTLISGAKLKELVHQNPIVQKDGLYQYFKPEKDRLYGIVADVSRGKGLDYSAFQVVDVTKMPYQQACVYRNNAITPTDYASIIYHMAVAYNNAIVLVEINDIGEQVAHSIHYDFGYENILYTENAGRSGKRITAGFGGSNANKGIRTTKIVKSIGCSILKLIIEQNQFIVNDHQTISELSTFSKKANSYEAEPGKHDDLVMCLVLFAWLSEQMYFKEYTSINTLMSLRDKTDEDIESDLSPFGFIVDGREDDESSYGIEPQWVRLPYLDF